ncbi:MAG: hypothetical protein R2733_17550 [Acidimicrobiales bacterium]
MDDRQFSLLANLIDGLDRLYDQKSSVIDTYALLHATGCALSGSDLGEDIAAAADGVLRAVRSGAAEPEKNRAALAATDALRVKVSEAWGEGYLERYPPSGRDPK